MDVSQFKTPDKVGRFCFIPLLQPFPAIHDLIVVFLNTRMTAIFLDDTSYIFLASKSAKAKAI